jgi:CRP-like cAMP-binding protein
MRPVLESAFMRFVRAELGTVPVLFDNSKEEALEELAPFWELQEVGTAGEIIFGKGDEGNTLYVLISGTVTVENANKGAQPPPTLDVELVVEVNNDLQKALERFSAPDSDGENETMASLDVESFSRAGLGRPFFGEEAVLDGKPRASTVTACTPCLLLVLHRPHFGQLRKAAIDFGGRLERYRELRAQLLKTALSDMEERLQKAREEVAAKQATGREVAVGAPAAEASGAAQGRRSRRSSREVAVGAPDAAPLGAPAWQPLGIPGVPWKPTD